MGETLVGKGEGWATGGWGTDVTWWDLAWALLCSPLPFLLHSHSPQMTRKLQGRRAATAPPPCPRPSSRPAVLQQWKTLRLSGWSLWVSPGERVLVCVRLCHRGGKRAIFSVLTAVGFPHAPPKLFYFNLCCPSPRVPCKCHYVLPCLPFILFCDLLRTSCGRFSFMGVGWTVQDASPSTIRGTENHMAGVQHILPKRNTS